MIEIYLLRLSDMRGPVDRETTVAASMDPRKLQDFMDSFLVEPYTDEPSEDFYGNVHTSWNGSTLPGEDPRESLGT